MRTCLRRFQYQFSRSCIIPRSSRSINDVSILPIYTNPKHPVSASAKNGRKERVKIEGLDLSFLREDLRRWSLAGDADIEEQYRGYEQNRQAFTKAIKTLQAMTTSSASARIGYNVPIRGLYDTVYSTNTDPGVSGSGHCKDGQQMSYASVSLLKSIYELTHKTIAESTITSAELRLIFENTANRARLSAHAYTLAVSYCLRMSNYKLLRFFMYQAQDNGIAANSWLCHTVLAVFVHEDNLSSWAMALQMFADVGIKADIDTWNQLLTLGDRSQKEYTLRKLISAGLQPSTITQGILLPLHRTYYDNMDQFLASLKKVRWTKTLGDVLIGELLRTKDLTTIMALLSEDSFSLSIEGVDQILSHILAISAKNFNHQRIVKSLCRWMTLRQLHCRPRTFLLLYKLGAKIKRPSYSEMIYSKAVRTASVSRELKKRRIQDRQKHPRHAGTPNSRPSLDWDVWLHAS